MYEKPNINVSSSKVSWVFFVSNKSYASPNLVKFGLKSNNKSKSVSKRVFQVASSKLFQDICLKSENIASPRLPSRETGLFSLALHKYKVQLAPTTENMAVLTPKLGISLPASKICKKIKVRRQVVLKMSCISL